MVSPHYPLTTKSSPAKERDTPEFSGSSVNLLAPKDSRLFSRDGSAQIWTVSELIEHTSHCLCFAGSAKLRALNWNESRTIDSNWCFLESSPQIVGARSRITTKKLQTLGWHYSLNVIWIWSVVWQQNLQCNKVQARKKYNTYKNILQEQKSLTFLE